jgi:hypothetical protein
MRLLGLACCLVTIAAAPAAAKDVTRPLILVHGHEADSGVSCNGTWKDMMAAFRWIGYKGSFHPVQYYRGDRACDTYYGAGNAPEIADATSDTRIEDIAKAFAWYVYDEHNRRGRAVNVVAHSMGGLIVRYAIDQVQRQRRGWPPHLVIPSVVTLGTPHAGIDHGPWVAAACRVTGNDTAQCREMNEGDDFIEYLRDHARNPQGAYGTWWSVAGSHADDTVDEGSAVSMAVRSKLRWASDTSIEHGDYMHERLGPDTDAHCWRTMTGGEMREGRCEWPLLWTYRMIADHGY